MNITRLLVSALAVASVTCQFSYAQNKPVPLATLYKRFAADGNTSLSMPQLNQAVLVSGVVVGATTAVATSNAIVRAGATADGEELARLIPARGRAGEALGTLKGGEAFVAECTLAFSSGSYMALQNCTQR